MILLRLLLLLVVSCCYQTAAAQPYYFRSYGVKEGMSGNAVISILQDKRGFMWFGTRNGLNRFDGTSFRIFRNNPEDSLSIGSNYIGCLFETKSGHLWVGTHKGLYIYDPGKEVFSTFKKLPQIQIRSIVQDAEGKMWIIAGYELFRYNPDTDELRHFTSGNEANITLRLSSKNEVWVGTNSGSLKKYVPASENFVRYEFSKKYTLSAPIGNVRDLLPVSDSLILIGLPNQVLLFNSASLQVSDVFEKSQWANDLKVRCILAQSDSISWIGTETGIYTFNHNSIQIDRIEVERDNPYSLTDNVVFSSCKDVEGGTWIGTFYGGVNYYTAKYNKFHKYFHQPDSPDGFKGNVVHEIVADNKGKIWIGTEDAGLNCMDTLTGKLTHFQADGGSGSISDSKIHGLVADSNELWIGTLDQGLDVMDLKTRKVIRHYNSGTDTGSLKSNFIVTLYRTRNKTILVGTSRGLFRYNRKADNFSPVLPYTMQIQAIHEDKHGTIWLCSYGQGVYYYNHQNGKSGSIRHITGDTASLINDYVNNILEDSKGDFWFCTEEGLTWYDPRNGKIRNYTTANGLPDNQVFRILEDDAGRYWLSTSHGLVQFDPNTKSLRKFGTADGLLSEQFNYNSAFKSGPTLFFGSVKGLISFRPDAFTQSRFLPQVYIADIQINNKSLSARDATSPIKTAVSYSEHLDLPYDQSDISFDVAALSYAAPEKNEYRYMLSGLDKEWKYIGTNRRIFYTKLPPGNYVFRVMASNSDGVWNTTETTLSLTIHPPWWLITWAIVLYILAALSIVAIIVRYYHLMMKEKANRRMDAFQMEKERETYQAKIDFFTNVTHEIKTPLTLIKLPVEQLMKANFDNEEVKENLHMINRNTDRLIDLSNQLLDFRKAESDGYAVTFIETNFSSLLKEEFLNFKPAADARSLSFTLELSRVAPLAQLDPDAFRKIVSNLFSNAIKYAKSTVAVKLLPFGSDDERLSIEFRNDGHIIPYELRHKIFEPFYRLTETETESGTGIGLSFAKSLVDLHHGSLTLEQPENGFNIFLLSLPILQEAAMDLPFLQSFSATAAAPESITDALADPSKPTLLLVEDNMEIINFLSKSLGAKYKILQAANGSIALQILEQENVALIISDIMMPVMDGIELCKAIKTDLQHSHIPIILLTAKNALVSKIEGLEVGADAYIEKPFALEHLQAQISNLMMKRDTLREYFASSPITHLKGMANSKLDQQFLERLQAVIHDHLTNRDLDVEQLSVLMNMSRPTLYRKIKALSHLAPGELITLTRLKRSAELLAEGYKVTEVADMVGYSQQNNFSRDFHKQFGITPTAYAQHK